MEKAKADAQPASKSESTDAFRPRPANENENDLGSEPSDPPGSRPQFKRVPDDKSSLRRFVSTGNGFRRSYSLSLRPNIQVTTRHVLQAIQTMLLFIHLVFALFRELHWITKFKVWEIELANWYLCTEIFLLMYNGMGLILGAISSYIDAVLYYFSGEESVSKNWLLNNPIVKLFKSYISEPHGVRKVPIITMAVYAAVQVLDLRQAHPLAMKNMEMLVSIILAGSLLDLLWNLLKIFIILILKRVCKTDLADASPRTKASPSTSTAQHAAALGSSSSSTKQTNQDTLAQVDKVVAYIQPIFFFIGVLFILDNMGISIHAFFGSIITLIISMQSMLQDFIATLILFIDKPFKKGDYIKLASNDTKGGTVEAIGIRSTMLRTSDGEQLILSNKDLSSSRIFKFDPGMTRRRTISWKLDIATDHCKVYRVPDLMKAIIDAQPKCSFLAAYLKKVDESGYEFELIWQMKNAEYLEFLRMQHKVNTDILDGFRKEGILLAVPKIQVLNSASFAPHGVASDFGSS